MRDRGESASATPRRSTPTCPSTPPLGEPAFTSTLRFGPVPFDRHRLTLVEWDAGVGFLVCIVTDVVDAEPRIPGTQRVTGWLVARIFDRRHAVLAAKFGRR